MARLIFDRVPADSPDERWCSANMISSRTLSHCENKRGNRKLLFSCPYFSPLLWPLFPLLIFTYSLQLSWYLTIFTDLQSVDVDVDPIPPHSCLGLLFNNNNRQQQYFISPHNYYKKKNIYIQQMIGVLAVRNNLKVKNAGQPVERKDVYWKIKVRDTRTNRHRYTQK